MSVMVPVHRLVVVGAETADQVGVVVLDLVAVTSVGTPGAVVVAVEVMEEVVVDTVVAAAVEATVVAHLVPGTDSSISWLP